MILIKNSKFPLRLFQEKMGLEVVFNDYIVRRKALLDYKNIDFTQSPYWIFKRGLPMILVKNSKFPLHLFQDKMGLEVVFNDYIVRRKALLDYKNIDFTQSPYWIFKRGLPMILVKNSKFPLRLFQDKMGLEVVFDDYIVRKQARLDYKNMDFTQSPYWIFKRGQPMILVKNSKFPLRLFQKKMGLEVVFDNHPLRKQTFLDYKKY